jgi:NAD(P)-dependent dehydrogenase (short-subunit alcohol dehydrogenase family)
MKTWFITGASRGFGALVAERALANGANVVAAARNPNALVERLGKRPNLLALSLDVADEVPAKAEVEKFGRIDVVLNNAGFGLMGLSKRPRRLKSRLSTVRTCSIF